MSASLAFQVASASLNNVRLPAKAPRFSVRNTPSTPSARCEAFCPHGSFYAAPKDDQTSDNVRKLQAIVSRTIPSYWVYFTLWVKAAFFSISQTRDWTPSPQQTPRTLSTLRFAMIRRAPCDPSKEGKWLSNYGLWNQFCSNSAALRKVRSV